MNTAAQVQRPIPTTPTQFAEVTYPVSSLFALRPGESGAVTITWDNWCDPVVKGSRTFRRVPSASGCPRVAAASTPITMPSLRASTRTRQPNLIPPGRRWSDAFLRASVPGRPIHGRRGGVLRFRIVLKNVLKTAARFDRCPAYVQQLAPSGKVEVYELKCPAAHPIAPGRSLAFAMRVRVPQDAPLGGNGLFWELDPFGAKAPQLHARVTVDG